MKISTCLHLQTGTIGRLILIVLLSNTLLFTACSSKKNEDAKNTEGATVVSDEVAELQAMDPRELLKSVNLENKGFPEKYNGNEASAAVNGVYETFWDNGKVKEHYTFSGGKANGEFIKYNYEGQLEFRHNYKNDIAEGVWEDYAPRGGVWRLRHYKNGFENGESLTYHQADNKSTGVVESRDTFVNGFNHGTHVEYMRDGNVRYTGLNCKGVRLGKWTRYIDDGKQKGKIQIVENYNIRSYTKQFESYSSDRHGEYLEYDASTGTLIKKHNYSNGALNGECINYWPNSQIALKTFYVGGKKDGMLQIWNEQGKLLYSCKFEKDLKTGEELDSYDDGTPKSKGAYVNDKKEGPWVYYHPNGKISSKGVFKNDIDEGIWEYYYATGVLDRKSDRTKSHQDIKDLSNPNVRAVEASPTE